MHHNPIRMNWKDAATAAWDSVLPRLQVAAAGALLLAVVVLA